MQTQTTNTERVQKLITFSTKLYNKAIARASSLGVPFTEYVRHVVLDDIEENIEHLPTLDEETNAYIGKSFQDLKEGNYIVVKPNDKKGLNALAGLK
ncbi:MAG: hypothetical protein UT63_C0066G0016 [Candidatus Gottesmanbacteria bacterium GW2011_GWC2_39_8]|uniref:Uncharacterized protein n=1 Tax=Candidatus Gottesmanbacteria bacterium GW2011_GWC2_39_8 TaxID=1618450 RepID=A0A0G0S9X4_9BACT|nr:MAG: hypothetical protein UT63_C0066G0016 [Candidatus Gottesmanbacteria bacterium GW2011_GWC2_39_8]